MPLYRKEIRRRVLKASAQKTHSEIKLFDLLESREVGVLKYMRTI